MNLLLVFLVIFTTFMCAFFGVGWLLSRGEAELERLRLLDQLDQATANVQLPRAGFLAYSADPCGAGAQDPAYEMRLPITRWKSDPAAVADQLALLEAEMWAEDWGKK